MKLITIIIFSLYSFIECSDYVLENCMIHSPDYKMIVDLSSNTEDWKESHLIANGSYYFTLCPRKKFRDCPGFFCVKFDNGTILDLGSNYEGLTHDETVPDLFNIGLKGKSGSGEVNVLCDQTISDELPILAELNFDNLKYTFRIQWSSSTNCPQKLYVSRNNCILYAKSHSYDLRALMSTYDVTSASGTKYIINLCEVVDEVKCPGFICEVQNNRTKNVISLDYELRYLENKGLSFNFNTSHEKIIIKLFCRNTSGKNDSNTIRADEDDFSFHLFTPLVCGTPKMNCLLHLEHNVAYDLSPLHKIIGNHELNLPYAKKILLNFCGSLNYLQDTSCADGSRYFGCLVSKDKGAEAVATTANITFVRPGQISVKYQGNGNNSLFLNITLICAKNRTKPTVSGSNYSYNITWNTVTACPLKYAAGKDCEVDNLYENSKTDLKSLYNKGSDYYTVNGNKSFRINVCGKLNKSCSNNHDAAVCYKNSEGKEISIGETGYSEPTFVDGQFIFHLEGEPCHKNVIKSRIKIIMMCEFSDDRLSNSSLELLSSTKKDECYFVFLWKTPKVCGSIVSSNCLYTANLEKNYATYDLSSLKNLRENYVVRFNDSQIAINICHSLVPGYRIHCDARAGACLTNNSIESILSTAHENHEKSGNVGMVNKQDDDFKVVDDQIRLHYRNGEVCMTGNSNVYSTTIEFLCNKTAFHTEPQLLSVQDCNYKFTWTTSAACPVSETHICTTVDPVSKRKFDLTSLMGKDVIVEDTDIVIRVCHPVEFKGCPENSGSCFIRNNVYENIGNSSSDLQYAEGAVSLVYKGPKCKSTKIEFSCSNTNDLKPILVKQDSCSAVISWPTNLTCKNDEDKERLKCCEGIEDVCNRFTGTYEVEVNQTEKVFINICKPLLPKWGLLCPNRSMSCITRNLSLDSSTEKNLGSVMLTPKVRNDSALTLRYINGSVCHGESDTRYSTVITFVCDKNARDGQPVLINISNDCQYEFKWATSLMCNENCSLPKGYKNMDVLRQFQDWDKIIIDKNKQASSYILNLCKESDKCGSQICSATGDKSWKRFAEINSSRSVKVSNDKTELFYTYLEKKTEKDACGAEVDLICDNNNSGPGTPYLEEERDCFIHVVWKTNLACLPQKPSESVASSSAGAWIMLAVGLLVLVGVVSIILKNNLQLNLRSFLSRTFGYSRNCSMAELQELINEEAIKEEQLYIKNR